MYEKLSEQFNYYIENQDKFVKEYDGKTIVMKDFEIIGVYDDEWEAFEETQKEHEAGTFIVQRVSPGPEAYTVTIASNLVFAGVE